MQSRAYFETDGKSPDNFLIPEFLPAGYNFSLQSEVSHVDGTVTAARWRTNGKSLSPFKPIL